MKQGNQLLYSNQPSGWKGAACEPCFIPLYSAKKGKEGFQPLMDTSELAKPELTTFRIPMKHDILQFMEIKLKRGGGAKPLPNNGFIHNLLPCLDAFEET